MIQDVLLIPSQRDMLCNMFHHAFLEIRLLGWATRSQQAADLADAFHNILNEMCGPDGFSWDATRLMLEAYQTKFQGRNKFDYVAMLDESRRSGSKRGTP